MSRPIAWARPWPTASASARRVLRAGAWYPVVAEADDERVVLEVRHQSVAVPRHLVEIREKRPHRFTVVRHPSNRWAHTDSYGRTRAKAYAVCPASGHRLALDGEPEELVCHRCGYGGEVAWWETG